eukprot:TRINITY_DN1694_c0_g1_i2.p1 TRINITY_DN1694_c0_g1~~TRINITY_DN1694_c0_g1_i2.p1  ORF type:complete len:485 (-),score=165.86 TRINITY_DN1694_c0_g1_i2:165-1619(-)
MNCSISGQICKEPVISRDGNVFEKSLILKHLDSTGNCPITGEPMGPEELIEVKINPSVTPRSATATHIPGLLQIFQNEWDAVMLETFNLRKQLEATRRELSHALYQHDAACRVIARLIKERDEARNSLEQFNNQAIQSQNNDGDMEDEVDKEITPAIIKRMKKLTKKLSENRKKRQVNTVPRETLEGYSETTTQNTHMSSKPGILCLDFHPTQESHVITGGVDSKVVIYNRETKKKLYTLSGHNKSVLDVKFHPKNDIVFSCSQDNTVRVWNKNDNEFNCSHVLTNHTSSVTTIDLHPLNDYLISAGNDKKWGFHDINTGITLADVTHNEVTKGYSTAMIHPDGVIFGTGSNDIRIWDIKNTTSVAHLQSPHSGVVSGLCFSENGYYLVSGGSKEVKLWDLRTQSVIETYTFEDNFNLNKISLDYSGNYVACAGKDIRIFVTKTLEPVISLTNHSKKVTDVKWSRNECILGSTSMDRSLKFYSN